MATLKRSLLNSWNLMWVTCLLIALIIGMQAWADPSVILALLVAIMLVPSVFCNQMLRRQRLRHMASSK